MRLDVWLHANGYFESRSRAKLAVKKGLVLVNGRRVKPSYEVRGDERIEVLADDRPAGYYKLLELDEEWRIFSGDETVLDLGSSAGGFLLYASEKAGFVIGIEYSREFEDQLERIAREKENVRVIFGDAFTLDTSAIPALDLILCDLTLEPAHSMEALKRFLPRLKLGGRVVFVSKGEKANVPDELRVLREKKSEEKREWYLLLEYRG
ncbi:MAG: methyltransferase domain-containing protein [Archaeoglobi archaeon]|nr:methyltransferase domain-containing protein [Archaeoglobi archaeon]